jgi:hypothetical protein
MPLIYKTPKFHTGFIGKNWGLPSCLYRNMLTVPLKSEGPKSMSNVNALDGKWLLIVDDEPDVLETLTDILDMCRIDTAPDFESAEKFLSKNSYDAAVFDIESFLVDLIDTPAVKPKKSSHWFSKLKPDFDQTFGKGWREKDRPFWQDFDKTLVHSREELGKIL